MGDPLRPSVKVAQAWYCVDRCEPHGWRLQEAVVTHVMGHEAIVVQDGMSLQVDHSLLWTCYATTQVEAWRRAEQRMIERMDELRAARAAWLEK
jgi:hypothetical protein